MNRENKLLTMPSADDSPGVVILADGDYPADGLAARLLGNARRVVCCDGAAVEYIARGGIPYAIVGDCDSLDAGFMERFSEVLHCDPDQQTNDLTKAVDFCVGRRFGEITILGATGKREDHTVANISLLTEYMIRTPVRMVTGSGVFNPVRGERRFESFEGQQVSIFTISPDTLVTTRNLEYPLVDESLSCWWRGSLNSSKGEEFGIRVTGPSIVYRLFPNPAAGR